MLGKPILTLIKSMLLVAFLSTNCFAFADRTNKTTLFTDEDMSTGVAEQSTGVKVRHSVGFIVLIVTEEKAGGAGDVDIYAEYSDDNSTWYRAYTSDMAGVITVEGDIVTALQNVTRWIVFTPRMANYIRIVFDPDADSQITASLIFLEDR